LFEQPLESSTGFGYMHPLGPADQLYLIDKHGTSRAYGDS
jgi:hypothetical protein